MKALAWYGKGDIRCEAVPDPKIEHPRDAVIKITACAICGSDLHIYDGIIPSMKKGDVLGHENMGEVVEVGSLKIRSLKVGDRVVVPFTIACGECFFCRNGFYSGCERTNPDSRGCRQAVGQFTGRPIWIFSSPGRLPPAARRNICGYPTPTWGPSRFRTGLSDEQVLFLSDIFPTGYMAADFRALKGGETRSRYGDVARSASSRSEAHCLLGAGRVSWPLTRSPSA